jgi:hypothetical protein
MKNRFKELELRLAVSDSKFDVEEALKEVQEKTEQQVEIDTAYKWGARAIACFQLYKQTGKMKWYIQAMDYRHESIEHASLAMDMGKTLKEVETEIDKHKTGPKED